MIDTIFDHVIQYKDVFSLSEQDLGRTLLIRHHKDTGNARPIKQQTCRTLPLKKEDLLQCGIVKKSNSPWSSPVVLVTKKDESQQFCMDYREVNVETVKDAYPLPRIDDSLSALSGANGFSTLDLAFGCWQVAMEAVFVTTLGLYEWTAMPFGLTSSPSTFERLMDWSGTIQNDNLIILHVSKNHKFLSDEIPKLESFMTITSLWN